MPDAAAYARRKARDESGVIARSIPEMVRAAARPAWEQLTLAVWDAGDTVPCVGDRRSDWTSDVKDHRRRAARQCLQGCPVLALCSTYAAVADESWSVLAGYDFGPAVQPKDQPRQPKRKRS